jgi:hypothetical protein
VRCLSRDLKEWDLQVATWEWAVQVATWEWAAQAATWDLEAQAWEWVNEALLLRECLLADKDLLATCHPVVVRVVTLAICLEESQTIPSSRTDSEHIVKLSIGTVSHLLFS